MITLIVFILGVPCSVMAYHIGRMRTEARWNSRFALAWRLYAQRIIAGEAAARAVHEEFGDLHEKVKTWSFADGRRFVAAMKHASQAASQPDLFGSARLVDDDGREYVIRKGEQ